ncbi:MULTISPECIES: hypothetical protein [Anoxybacillus]|uniref:Uncharacterized protein n=1 Tax=Anoxybacillus flavithermus TaxID=33934 RepID=A0A178T5A5_9BACL|nr:MULTISPECIES: hypothetical protein [Anoxybacillus]MBW7649934.1 hypothetical protein [Anoxybacillus sp. ST4]OAO76493.1 hypothetical protein TAF16_2537 [Anoxybacillus flavithermus]
MNETENQTDNTSNGDIAQNDVQQYVDLRSHTTIETPEGNIHIIHEITLGEMIISVLIAATLIFMFLERMMRR